MIFVICGIIIIFCWWLHLRRARKLVPYMLEQLLRVDEPISLVGKPDVVWINGKGTLIVGDYKSRDHAQVFKSDRIQLSVYRFLLTKLQDKQVAKYGWIHFQNGKRKKVKLMSEKEITALYHRYWLLIDGKVDSDRTANKRYCKFCSHRCE